MLTLVNNTDANDDIVPEAHGLYRLHLKPNTQMAIENKPVFGANITLHSSVLKHDNFVATPDNILGWLDHCGLSHFAVKAETDNSESEDTSVLLPSQFLNAEGGILRVTAPTRIYLISKTPIDINKRGLCLFTPVK
ncbi:conserved hypothetical protein [Alteromonas macleodii]|jgi:hypothetical protein|uniref:Uncharacterized protein n=2 Tax=Alteromonas TaxID=226 RepID=A0A0B3YS01_9ALTE|nr:MULTISPECIES: hypothetical protein [Alteromonas]MBS08958.1 hypothetical protein [Alteromonas sp.]MED5488072.1 hypothetical protein [Pseudomonadota bacterium]AMJ98796.1 hypothetical protein AVL55_11835 [Alteromonas macleodii]KHT57442.1 hypothetical protein RJ41_02060 [Alteromonas marina]KHT58084.1 hypothetical protein RJ44_14140 [Alteromonas macleodii]|tara:strand:+ start:220 stop:627 length:408 start_codon:yes stop_codon:yes gene_type:complete